LIDGTNRLINPPVEINGELAYVQQSPWIQNKTIRDNILYGLPLDKERYVDTIRLCELERDLEILPAGDQTEIGEKGINLSGGQKARIGLARAVYTTRDIFLMDDPISALDANVRKKIFMNVILDQLQGKTRLLVTHAIDFVHLADRIILMDKGRIVEQGPFEKLIENAKFRNLV
jgi:ABC-type multidrug transport system fused ATPase/permease subunit